MNLSLNWFKSKKQKELEELKVEGQRLKNEVLGEQLDKMKKKRKLFKSLKLINDTLTIVMHGGSILTKTGATMEDFKNVKEATTEDEVMYAVSSKEVVMQKKAEKEEYEKVVKVREGASLLSKIDDFKLVDDSVYMVGTNRTMPKLLVEEFSKIVAEIYNKRMNDDKSVYVKQIKEDVRYQALRNFFLWACLNPRAEVANELYDFLCRNSFRITKQGFFAALRNVVSLDPSATKSNQNTKVKRSDANLVEFVSNSYQKIKAVWKKKPEKYVVYESEDFEGYKLTQSKTVDTPEFQERNHSVVGGLADLYVDLPNLKENRYTDAHTKTFDIRVGKVVNMPMEECSWSTADCMEAGLHFTADEIHYVGCGDTSVLVLINPMKVVGIGTSKGRCYEYLPIMTVPRNEATKLLHDMDFDTLELDEDYAIKELDGLLDVAKDGFKAETTKHKFNLPSMSTGDMANIVKSLSEMRDVLSKRVSSID